MKFTIPQIKGPLKNFLLLVVSSLATAVWEQHTEVKTWIGLLHVLSDAGLHTVLMGFAWIAMQSAWRTPADAAVEPKE